MSRGMARNEGARTVGYNAAMFEAQPDTATETKWPLKRKKMWWAKYLIVASLFFISMGAVEIFRGRGFSAWLVLLLGVWWLVGGTRAYRRLRTKDGVTGESRRERAD